MEPTVCGVGAVHNPCANPITDMGLDPWSARADYSGLLGSSRCLLVNTNSGRLQQFTLHYRHSCEQSFCFNAASIRTIRHQQYLMCTVGVHAWALFLSSEVILSVFSANVPHFKAIIDMAGLEFVLLSPSSDWMRCFSYKVPRRGLGRQESDFCLQLSQWKWL